VRFVDVALGGQLVVVRVARDDDRLVHVDDAMPARLVVAEAMRVTGNLEVPGVRDRLRGGTPTRGERSEREEGLIVDPADRPP